jgi:hypothetical protein
LNYGDMGSQVYAFCGSAEREHRKNEGSNRVLVRTVFGLRIASYGLA